MSGIGSVWTVRREYAEHPSPPLGFAVAMGFVAAIAASFATAAAGGTRHLGAALAGYAVAVAAVSLWSTAAGGLATAGMSWLFMNGFLVHRAGELRWHGGDDVVRLGVLAATALAASGVRWVVVRRGRPALPTEDDPYAADPHLSPERLTSAA